MPTPEQVKMRQLRTAKRRCDRAAAARDEARDTLNQAAMSALAAGAPLATVAATLDVSKARVSNLKKELAEPKLGEINP